MEFRTHWKFCAYRKTFDFRKGPDYLYGLFDVLPKQATYETKSTASTSLQV